jgi:hypothetical protein
MDSASGSELREVRSPATVPGFLGEGELLTEPSLSATLPDAPAQGD